MYLLAHTAQGGHELLDVHTKRAINQAVISPIPVTPSVINVVEQMALDDDMKGLKIRTKTNQILYDSAWIAGVDYDEDADDEDYSISNDSDDGNESDGEDDSIYDDATQ